MNVDRVPQANGLQPLVLVILRRGPRYVPVLLRYGPGWWPAHHHRGRFVCGNTGRRKQKRAFSMRGRLAALLGPAQTPRWVDTLHAIMARLMIGEGAGMPWLPQDAETDTLQRLRHSDWLRQTGQPSERGLLKLIITESERFPVLAAFYRDEVLARSVAIVDAVKILQDCSNGRASQSRNSVLICGP
jgi:hypothetical protein